MSFGTYLVGYKPFSELAQLEGVDVSFMMAQLDHEGWYLLYGATLPKKKLPAGWEMKEVKVILTSLDGEQVEETALRVRRLH